MSLYYHLPAREALLDGVAEAVIAEITAAADHVDTEDGWRVRLRRRFLAARQVMLRHPWAPGLLHSRKTVPAGVYAYCDAIVGTLVGAGFSYHLAHRAIRALGSLPLGFAQQVFSPASAGGSIEIDTAEMDMSAMAATAPALRRLPTSDPLQQARAPGRAARHHPRRRHTHPHRPHTGRRPPQPTE
jgi:AcrR family transcriptional regulator